MRLVTTTAVDPGTGSVVLTVSGEADLGNAPQLHAEVGRAVALLDGRPLVVDADGLLTCDGIAKGVLADAANRARAAGASCELRGWPFSG